MNKYSTTEDLTRWQNQKIANISVKSLIDLIDQTDVTKELSETSELYASIGIEYKKLKKGWDKVE